MHNLSKKTIINRTNLSSTYFKGQVYYNQGKVREVRATTNRDYFIANVYGKSKYEVSVGFHSNGDINQSSCTCKAYKKYPGDCKHIVALLLFIMDIGDRKQKEEKEEKKEKIKTAGSEIGRAHV